MHATLYQYLCMSILKFKKILCCRNIAVFIKQKRFNAHLLKES